MKKLILPFLVMAAAIAVAVMWRVNPDVREILADAVHSAKTVIMNVVEDACAAWQRAHPAGDEVVIVPASSVAVTPSAAVADVMSHEDAVRTTGSTEDVKLPSALGILSIDPMKATWAVLRLSTPVRGIDGSELGTVAGGRFFEISSRFRTDDGLRLVGNFAPRRLTVDAEIPADAVYGFTGDWRSLSTAQRQALRMYYQLTGEIEKLRTGIQRDFARRSPYFEEAAEALRTFRARAEAIEKETNLDVEGKRKATYALTPLRQKVQELNAKHHAWKEAHAAEVPDPAQDPRIQKLEEQRQTHAKLIGGMAF